MRLAQRDFRRSAASASTTASFFAQCWTNSQTVYLYGAAFNRRRRRRSENFPRRMTNLFQRSKIGDHVRAVFRLR